MKHLHLASLRCLVIASALLCGGTMAAQAHVTGLRIVVRDTHYALGRSAFGDLDALAAAVSAAAPRAIDLYACGPGANHALLGAAHRFSRLPLRMQVLNADDAVCMAAPLAVRISQRGSAGPTGIDDAAVVHYWLQVMP
jgi:hypothetical protein